MRKQQSPLEQVILRLECILLTFVFFYLNYTGEVSGPPVAPQGARMAYRRAPPPGAGRKG